MNILIIGATSAIAQAVMTSLQQQPANRFYCFARNQQKQPQLQQLLGDSLVGCQFFDFNDSTTIPEALAAVQQSFTSIDLVFIDE